MNDELNVRISIVETKIDSIQSDLTHKSDVIKQIFDKIDEVKTFIDKQNGMLPMIKSALSNIEKQLEDVNIKYNEQMSELSANKVYIKVLWSLVIPLGLTVVGGLIKFVFFN